MSEEQRYEEARRDFTDRRAWEMSLADLLGPIIDKLDQGEKASSFWWEFDARHKDGTLIRVKLQASVVEHRWRMRAWLVKWAKMRAYSRPRP